VLSCKGGDREEGMEVREAGERAAEEWAAQGRALWGEEA